MKSRQVFLKLLQSHHLHLWKYINIILTFCRQLANFDEVRPIDEDPAALTSPGDINWNWGKTNVKLDDELYLKNETYSLQQIFDDNDNDNAQAKYYVDGAIGRNRS